MLIERKIDMCTHPYTAFNTHIKTENGKEEWFLSREHSFFIPAWQVMKKYKVPYASDLTEFVEVPCGRCYECRKEKARRWAFRCLVESWDHDSNLFVTLTYGPALFLPKDKKAWKKDLQRFFYRLRSAGFKFRYFAAGELGEKFKRPHFHVLFFGLKLDDLKPWSGSGVTQLYRSAKLEKYWPYGFALVGQALPGSVGNYIAKYTVKGDPKEGFLVMSRKPGIGFNGIQKMLDEKGPKQQLVVGDGKGHVMKSVLPRSFREKVGLEADPAFVELAWTKLCSQMRKAGYSESDCYDFGKIEEFRESLELSDKKKEVFFKL